MPKALRFGIWVLVAALAALAFGRIALVRGETINAAWLLTAALCSYAIAYRFYSKLIAAKVFAVALALRLKKMLPVANLLFAAVVAWNLLVLVGLHWRVF